MNNDKLQEWNRALAQEDMNSLVEIMSLTVDNLVKKRLGQRRLGAFRFEDKTIIFGCGSWAKDLGNVYQAWFAQQVDMTPPEFMLDHISKGMLGVLFDSFNRKQLHVAISYLQHRLETCQSTSLERAPETLKSFSSEKLPDEKKPEMDGRLLGDQASS